MSGLAPWRSPIMFTASWITVSVLRPSRSILSMPTFSSAPISYCVMMDSPSAAAPAPLVGAVHTGTYSESGPGAITTPAAWTDMWREIPSIRELSLTRRS